MDGAAAFDELAFDDVVAPTFVPADEPATIDLVAAEAEAASVDVAVAADFDLDQPASVSDPDPDPEPGSGSAPAKPEPTAPGDAGAPDARAADSCGACVRRDVRSRARRNPRPAPTRDGRGSGDRSGPQWSGRLRAVDA